jgi:SAM-dependent methyltransferase
VIPVLQEQPHQERLIQHQHQHQHQKNASPPPVPPVLAAAANSRAGGSTTMTKVAPRRSLSFVDHIQKAAAGGQNQMSKEKLPKRMCPCCGWQSVDGGLFEPYGKGRLDAKCPQCGALERHRTSCAVLGTRPELLDVAHEHKLKRHFDTASTGSLRMIYFGPHKTTAQTIDESTYRVDQIWADYKEDILYNHGKRTTKTVHADIMNLQFPDHFAHGAIILHVLEHIPDLQKAFAELKRVLKPYSWLLLEVPYRESIHTKDCRSATNDAERLVCAGQKDHVWSFSIADFERELTMAQFVNCTNVHPFLQERLGPIVYDRLQLRNNFQGQPFPQYLCRTPIN